MALRTIRVEGDPVLTKISRPVDKMTPRIQDLITDMLDAMYDAMGVGLAAPPIPKNPIAVPRLTYMGKWVLDWLHRRWVS